MIYESYIFTPFLGFSVAKTINWVLNLCGFSIYFSSPSSSFSVDFFHVLLVCANSRLIYDRRNAIKSLDWNVFALASKTLPEMNKKVEKKKYWNCHIVNSLLDWRLIFCYKKHKYSRDSSCVTNENDNRKRNNDVIRSNSSHSSSKHSNITKKKEIKKRKKRWQ